RHLETTALAGEASDLEEQLQARKVIDRAKGHLMDDHGMSENDSFRFIQTTAMGQRRSMRDVAVDILEHGLVPDTD
ncbi:MAG: ANTAR domain-containing protein, partial [Acidimicrobiia bacterium]|nr:ANTAR domain-containing protein [Acidimicrobiia bacterium]